MSRELEERNRSIYEMFCNGYPMNDIADTFGVTRQRIGQIVHERQTALPDEDNLAVETAELDSLIAECSKIIRGGPVPKFDVKGGMLRDDNDNPVMDYEGVIKALDLKRRALESRRRLQGSDRPRRKQIDADVARKQAEDYLASLPRAEVVE